MYVTTNSHQVVSASQEHYNTGKQVKLTQRTCGKKTIFSVHEREAKNTKRIFKIIRQDKQILTWEKTKNDQQSNNILRNKT